MFEKGTNLKPFSYDKSLRSHGKIKYSVCSLRGLRFNMNDHEPCKNHDNDNGWELHCCRKTPPPPTSSPPLHSLLGCNYNLANRLVSFQGKHSQESVLHQLFISLQVYNMLMINTDIPVGLMSHVPAGTAYQRGSGATACSSPTHRTP